MRWLVTMIIVMFCCGPSGCEVVAPLMFHSVGAGTHKALAPALTKEGRAVRVNFILNEERCKWIGDKTVKIDGVLRSFDTESWMAADLLTLARNSAAAMGGNAVVEVEQPKWNLAHYDVYKCDDVWARAHPT